MAAPCGPGLLLVAPGGCLRPLAALAAPSGPWRLLGCSWRPLAASGDHWLPLAAPGGPRRPLAAPGGPWPCGPRLLLKQDLENEKTAKMFVFNRFCA